MLSILLWLMVIAEIHNQSDTHKLPLKHTTEGHVSSKGGSHGFVGTTDNLANMMFPVVSKLQT